jgi:SWI/SNF-related matrix-associated actin-dependent regulator 1 of chromatin subfamily A
MERAPRFHTPQPKEAKYNSKNEKIKILFPFDRDLIKEIKTIPGRKYHNNKSSKFWSAPVSVDAINVLDRLGFTLDPALQKFRSDRLIKPGDVTANIDIPGLKGTLFPFQAEGVSFIDAKNGNALVGDEMGLGKTVQALAYLQLHTDKRPAVIVCPASLKLNWKKEAEAWIPDSNVEILNGTTPYKTRGSILIINYSILKDWVDDLTSRNLEVFILDEVHYTKNSKSKRTKAAKKIAKHANHVIGLTGTPIVNRPVEIVNVVQMIDKSVIPNKWSFLHRYCGATHNGFGWDFSGASNTKELHQKLTSSIMIRRRKKDVLKDLPDKMRSYIPIELDNLSTYKRAEQDFIEYVKDQTEVKAKLKMEQLRKEGLGDILQIDDEKLQKLKERRAESVNVLTEIEELKQLAVKGKLKSAIQWIRDFLESGEKLVVMATHKFVINELMEAFGDIAVKVDGSVSGVDRDIAVMKFQENKKIRLFVGNIKAAGVGLTLTAASSEVFLELPWTPGDVVQAEDRIHRIGQEEAVNIYYLLAKGTIEEEIAALIDEKRKVLDSVLDGEDTDTTSLISELMKKYTA